MDKMANIVTNTTLTTIDGFSRPKNLNESKII